LCSISSITRPGWPPAICFHALRVKPVAVCSGTCAGIESAKGSTTASMTTGRPDVRALPVALLRRRLDPRVGCPLRHRFCHEREVGIEEVGTDRSDARFLLLDSNQIERAVVEHEHHDRQFAFHQREHVAEAKHRKTAVAAQSDRLASGRCQLRTHRVRRCTFHRCPAERTEDAALGARAQVAGGPDARRPRIDAEEGVVGGEPIERGDQILGTNGRERWAALDVVGERSVPFARLRERAIEMFGRILSVTSGSNDRAEVLGPAASRAAKKE